jgi:membrane associated rhomboid family serine protease
LENNDRKQLLATFFFPVYVVALMWVVKLTEIILNISFVRFGLFPRTAKGILGIFTFPFIHGDFEHLISNSVPMVIIGAVIFYAYRPVAYRIYFFTYLLTGIVTWLIARPAYHIGASGMVYSFASFIFFSGLIRQHPRLMAMSLLVVFLYGSMAWGIFPMKEEISWEGHLSGAVIGLLLAIYYQKQGTQKIVYDWELNDDDDYSDIPYNGIEQNEEKPTAEQQLLANTSSSDPLQFNYIYLPKVSEKTLDPDEKAD